MKKRRSATRTDTIVIAPIDLQQLSYRDKFRSLYSHQFQSWFESIAQALHPNGDFQPVRSTRGDGGLDGFVISSRLVYQVYAPSRRKEDRDSETAAKIVVDFNNALSTLGGRLKKWIFVHNHPEAKLGHLSIAAVNELKNKHPEIELSVLDINTLWQLLAKLEDTTLTELFGPTAERSQDYIKFELRARMRYAQDLDARDESCEALAILEESYHKAKAHGLRTEALEALLSLAFAKARGSDLEATERRLKEAERLLAFSKCDAWHQVQVARLKALVLVRKKKFSVAEKHICRALSLSQPGNNDIEVVNLLARADYIHLLCSQKRIRDADEHVALLRSVLVSPKEHHVPVLLAAMIEACIHWAVVASGTSMCDSIIQLAIKNGTDREAAICLGHALQNAANGATGQKAFDAALACADGAETLANVAKRTDLALAAAYTGAAALAHKKDFHAVRKICLRLADWASTIGQPTLAACVFHLLSQACRQLGDTTSSIRAAQSALLQAGEDATALTMTKMALAEALYDSGRVKEAIEQGRVALQLAQNTAVPPEWIDQTIALLARCAARLGDWVEAENHISVLEGRPSGRRSTRLGSIKNDLQVQKSLRGALEMVAEASQPLRLARTEGASSVQEANSMLVGGLLDGWREFPQAASALYDYWGRGNLTRGMLNMRAFPRTLNLTIEVHCVNEARQAIRLWGLIADVLILIWKGPTISSGVFCPVPDSWSTVGGAGYFAAAIRAPPPNVLEVTGLCSWKGKSRTWKTTAGPTSRQFAVFTRYASLLPAEIGHFLATEAVQLVALGRLLVVPATGIGCLDSGHSVVERLFADACNAIPAIRGDAASLPAAWLPYFPDIPLTALADVIQEHAEPLRRLRLALLRKTREFPNGQISAIEAKVIELEIQDSIASLADRQSGLRRRHGWSESEEAVSSRYETGASQDFAPLFLLESMGYRWRVEPTFDDGVAEKPRLPVKDEPILSWLESPDSRPKVVAPANSRAILPRREAIDKV